MSYPDSDEQADRVSTEDGSFDRRTYVHGLGVLAAAVGGIGAGADSAAAATTRRGIEFDRVVNVVDDLGVDNSGNDPVQWQINNADQEGTLFVFPEGEYFLTDRLLLMYNDTVGVVGQGDARFVVPENYNKEAVVADRGQDLLFENVDLDLRADGATPGYKFGVHRRGVVRDVELIGQGTHPDSDPRGEGGGDPDVTPALHLMARESSADLTVENFVAQNRGIMGAYNRGKGRTGVWIGRSNTGTVTMRNCHVSGFPNNGLYTSRTHGVVQVEGGVFRNNDISQVRLGSEGSYVEGAFMEVDPAKSKSPNPEDMLNGRGVRIESGPIKTGGVTVRDCDIVIADGDVSEGGVIVAPSGGEFEVVDTRIRVDSGWVSGVRAKRPTSGGYAPPWPRHARLKNVSVTGGDSSAPAVVLEGRPDSTVTSCCIEQGGDDRTAVKLVDCGETVVKNSTLDVPGETLEVSRTNLRRWGISTNGSCPLPQSSGAATTRVSQDDDSGNDDGGDTDESNDRSAGGSMNRVSIVGEDRCTYRLEVSGSIERGAEGERSDVSSSSAAVGEVGGGGWADSFKYTGRIDRLVIKASGRTFIYDRGSGRLAFKTNGDEYDYEASVDADLWRTHATDDGAPDKGGDGASIEGTLDRRREVYGTTGGLKSVNTDGFFSVDITRP